MSGVCRICLQAGASVPLFQAIIDDISFQMFHKFILCTSVQVSDTDTMPKVLCAVCTERLEDAYRLREQAQRSDANLRQQLGLIKIEYPNENIWNREILPHKKETLEKVTISTEYGNNDQSSNGDQNGIADDFDDVKCVNDGLDIRLKPLLRETILKVSKSKSVACLMAGDIKVTKLCKKQPKKSRNNNRTNSKNAVSTRKKRSGLSVYKIVQKTRNNSENQNIDTKISYECQDCPKVFSDYSTCKTHMEEDHPKFKKIPENKFMCETCGKTCPGVYALELHMRVHTGDRPFICTVCEKRFIHAGNLKNHVVAVHRKEKPFECKHCPSRFSCPSSLHKHTKIHTGERKYPCGLCEKRFIVSTARKRHQLLHTQAKPYMCKICKGTYTRHENLKSHVTKTHLEVSTEEMANYCEKIAY